MNQKIRAFSNFALLVSVVRCVSFYVLRVCEKGLPAAWQYSRAQSHSEVARNACRQPFG